MDDPFERLRARAAAILAEGERGLDPAERAMRMAEETRLLQTELALQQQELADSQRALQALHERYYQLFELAPVGHLRLSPDQRIVEANQVARALLGIDLAQGQPLGGFVAPSSRAGWIELLAGRTPETRLVLVGRATVTVDARMVPWAGDGGWLVSLHDVTALSVARTRQAEAEERFAHVVDAMEDGLVVVGADTGLVVAHNAAFARIVGRQASLVGVAHDSLLAARTRGVHAAALAQAAAQRGHARVAYARSGEDDRVCDVSSGRLGERGASVDYLVVRDVTDAVRAEEQQRLAAERRVETQRLEALGMLAAGVAHDMNNVLAAVLTAAELPPSDETVREIHTAALRGRELTERLLAVSRRRPGRSEAFDLLEVLREACSLARRTFRREIQIDLDCAPGAWVVQGDAGQWHQAVLNLLINARDAVGEAGRVVVTAAAEGEHKVVSVRDDGCGMAPDVVQRAFEPFFTTKADGGTGLGLAHVRSVVIAHGGETRIVSSVGHGTDVRLELPASAVEVRATSNAPPAQAKVPLTARHVLVVDDDDAVGRLTGRTLERLGATTTRVTSAAAAIAAIEGGRFDVVLTDRSMPGISGDLLCRVVRCRWPSLPVVVMTGLTADDDVDALRAAGASAIVGKPFRSGELAAVLSAAATAPPAPPTDVRGCGLPDDVCACALHCERRPGGEPVRS